MRHYNNKEKIIEHYDLLSPFYYALWGKHLHHGYWITGKETKEEAQVALIKHLAQAADIMPYTKILDVGCGFGGSSIYLSNLYNAETTGITISQVQVTIAQEDAEKSNAKSHFLLMDAESMNLNELYDTIWSIESISHYKDKSGFFKKAAELLKPNGTVAIIDWFKKENLTDKENKKYILPIEKGMLVELKTMREYFSILETNGLKIIQSEDISENTAKTWDLALDIIKNTMFWKLAIRQTAEFTSFIRSFRAMREGFSSSNFVYGLIVAKK